MTNMAAMPIYGKNLNKSSSPLLECSEQPEVTGGRGRDCRVDGALLSSLLQSLLYGVGCCCFLALRPFEALFQPISGRLPERGRKKRE